MEIEEIVRRVIKDITSSGFLPQDISAIPVGISNRHIHLSQGHIDILFGTEVRLKKMKELSQPGQFAYEECVTIAGPKGCIEKVRVLGPPRLKTQIEILASDCHRLGITAPVRESGKLQDTPKLCVVGPYGCLQLDEGVIIAQRHIHMTQNDANRFLCKDGDNVHIEYKGIRGGRLDNVIIRVSDTFKLDFHIDLEEANCLGIKDGEIVRFLKF